MKEQVSIITSISTIDKSWDKFINSILAQTYRPLELILVLDGIPLAQNVFQQLTLRFKKQEIGLTIIKNKERIGLTKSLNKAINAANGEFLARIDGSCWSVPERIEQQVKYLQENNLDIVGSFLWITDKNRQIFSIQKSPTKHTDITKKLERNNCLNHPTILTKTSAVQNIGGYDQHYQYAQDYDLYLRLILKGHKFGVINECLVYKQHTKPSTTILKRKQQLQYAFSAQKRYLKKKAPQKKSILNAFFCIPHHLWRIHLPNWSRSLNILIKKKFNKHQLHVFGIRGFPHIQGGAEIHSENLYQRIAACGIKTTIYRRKRYLNKRSKQNKKGIIFKDFPCLSNPGLETLSHSFLVFISLIFHRPAIVHIHNIGSGIFVLPLRLLGWKVIFTYHSINYHHTKWDKLAKTILKIGCFSAIYFAHRVIVVSEYTKKFLEGKYGKKSKIIYIPNGATSIKKSSTTETLKKHNLQPKKYIFTACRFSPEKGLHNLIYAYQKIKNPEFKIVIAGDDDHKTNYGDDIRIMAKATKGIELTGFISGNKLSQLYENAGLFVLPSYSEGMPLALLEAISYEIPVLISDIPQLREFQLPEERYFKTEDRDELARKMIEFIGKEPKREEREYYKFLLLYKYNWTKTASQTFNIYSKIQT